MGIQNKILVVDDDPVNRDFFQLMLSKLGFTVEEAFDGVDALEKLKNFRPELILLDNVMPRMSGFDLTKCLKGDPQYHDIPIIMFSALNDVQDKLTGFELGVNDYITKPFNFSEVLTRINTVLRNRELFDQIMARDSRLSLAESLCRDMEAKLADCTASINDVDTAAAALITSGDEPVNREALSRLSGTILEKTGQIRKYIDDLNMRIEETVLEWESIKKNEKGIPSLENQMQKYLRQE